MTTDTTPVPQAPIVQCPVCGDIIPADEPCWCVYTSNGTLDEDGVLHTAIRVPYTTDVA